MRETLIENYHTDSSKAEEKNDKEFKLQREKYKEERLELRREGMKNKK